MSIFQTAHYQVNAQAVDRVVVAIAEFIEYVKENEPGTRMYTSWQKKDDPTRFVHLFKFDDEVAHAIHGSSAAVKRFESVYKPELVGGPVVFTDYLQIATNLGG
jgi:quinol monooxygenase YgiN